MQVQVQSDDSIFVDLLVCLDRNPGHVVGLPWRIRGSRKGGLTTRWSGTLTAFVPLSVAAFADILEESMEILKYIFYALGVIVTVGWLYGIRVHTMTGEGVNKGTVNITMLFLISLILVPLLDISTFHLLWLFPLSVILGFLSITFPFSVLWIPGRIVWRMACIGIDMEEASKRHEKIRRAQELVLREGLSVEEAIKRVKEEV